MVEKFSEAFTNAIKKANIFEKFIEVKRMCLSLIFLTTIIGATTIVNELYINYRITFIQNKNSFIENRVAFLDKK